MALVMKHHVHIFGNQSKKAKKGRISHHFTLEGILTVIHSEFVQLVIQGLFM